uniref:Uncharacterized protein n=1 Tax=Anguilla anguilla TaxID=7936 RepID=A0A0E9WWI1_ANGAN
MATPPITTNDPHALWKTYISQVAQTSETSISLGKRCGYISFIDQGSRVTDRTHSVNISHFDTKQSGSKLEEDSTVVSRN